MKTPKVMAKASLERINPRAELIARVEKIKPMLPKNWRTILYAIDASYNTPKGKILLNNVIALRTADTKVTELMESVAYDYIQWPAITTIND